MPKKKMPTTDSLKEPSKNTPIPTKPITHQQKGKQRGGGGGGSNSSMTVNKAKADAFFASQSSQWYAGAAFDRSPAAHTLPPPSKLLISKSPSRLTRDLGLFATSCPQPVTDMNQTCREKVNKSKTRTTSPKIGAEDLELKSKNLLDLIKANKCVEDTKSEPIAPKTKTNGTTKETLTTTTPNTSNKKEELEEMTKQVRRLLNLS